MENAACLRGAGIKKSAISGCACPGILLRDNTDAIALILPDNRKRCIIRPIVDDHHFNVGVRLIENGVDGFCYPWLRVVHRNDY